MSSFRPSDPVKVSAELAQSVAAMAERYRLASSKARPRPTLRLVSRDERGQA